MFLCFNVCCFCRLVAYHDVTAVCMYVPVRGHHTNTMNVDIVKSFILFFFSKGLCGHVIENLKMGLCDCVFGSPDRLSTWQLLIMGLF